MTSIRVKSLFLCLISLPFGIACGGFDPLVPPAEETEMAAWLQAFADNSWENDWVCEAAPTDKRASGSPAIHVHGPMNRVCNNPALADAMRTGAEALPVGVAAIKFVGESTFVEVKVQADSAAGAGWYWYAPSDGVAALGATGCTNCHSAAGADADHPGLGDYVYFQVAR